MNPPSQFPRRSPPSYAAAPGGGRNRGFDSPPRHSPRGFGTGGFRPTVPDPPPPLSGQKRGNPYSARGGSPDRFDKGGFAKLFVGSVPRTATEGEIRPLFEQHGEVVEVALIKDKKTGQQQGCCFIKYATSEEADRAIRALHNQHTLHGGLGPIQVRYADGERERLGAVEYKLFVGSMNKQATEKEVEEVFSPYGVVEDVYLMRDELKQSRGCGFVKYSSRDMALSAINGLNGIYTMRGCDQPLTVRFADPKRPRPGDSRNAAFGGPGSGPRFQAPGARPVPNFSEPMSNHFPTSTWHPSPTNLGLPNPGIRGFGAQMLPRSGDMALLSNSGGHGSSVEGPLPGIAVSSSTTQQSFNQSTPHVGQQISPLQKPIQSPQSFPPSLQQYPQTTAPYAVPQAARPVGLPHAAGQIPYSQALPSQKLHGLEPPSQLAQMLSQQTQNLQASFQSSQQAFNQLQQQLQQMQPSKQGLSLHQTSQSTKQQPSQWTGIVPQTVANIPATKPAADTPSATSVAPVIPGTNLTVAPPKCIWTEHTSPDGYKYYYNSSTGESRWEKPAELALSEKQQQHQKPSIQQPQTPSLPQNPSSQQHSQIQQRLQPNLQPQLRPHHQLQQQSIPSTYQTSGTVGQKNAQDFGYSKVPTNSSVSDPRFQQGVQAAQEWMWKNKPTGA